MVSTTAGRICAGERPLGPSATLFLRSQAVTVAVAGRRTARVPDVVRPHPAPAGTPGATCCGVPRVLIPAPDPGGHRRPPGRVPARADRAGRRRAQQRLLGGTRP